jgi:outer membrane immunogenic protein
MTGELARVVGVGSMMRMLIILTFAFTAAGQALAADQLVPVPPSTFLPQTVNNWGGYYIGVNAGYGIGISNWSDPNNPGNSLIGGTTPPGTTTGDFNVSGALAGVTVGLNYQVNAIVFGIESDVDWSGMNGSTTPANGFCNLPVSAAAVGANCQTKLNWLGTARLRAGYATDRLFAYATAGAAFSNLQTGLTGLGLAGSPPATGLLLGNLTFGWTAGAGIEFVLLEGWSAKAEYLFVNLGHVSCNVQTNCGIDSATFSGFTPANDEVSFKANIVRFGVNYKFLPW